MTSEVTPAPPGNQSVQELYRQIEQFHQNLADDAWVATVSTPDTETLSASDLFAKDEQNRPLVVGLFGGTGVGKSTLLNRLAGDDIAKTGVVRPTSTSITAYLHQSKSIARLPADFPANSFSGVTHSNSTFEDVMWVDMPDFDSEETQNRDQVLKWLPFIDVLVYVVTPERYKDAEGWRLLQSHGFAHCWLFVMNQWDKGEPVQLEDFRNLLTNTGFTQPRIFTTKLPDSEVIDSNADDEFSALSSLVAELSERKVVEQMERYGWFRRLGLTAARLQKHQTMFNPKDISAVDSFNNYWSDASQEVRANMHIPLQEYSQRFSPAQRSPVKNVLQAVTGNNHDEVYGVNSSTIAKDAVKLWDEWKVQRLNDAISQFELAESDHGIPGARLQALRHSLPPFSFDDLSANWDSTVLSAVANPGSSVQRAVHKVCRWLRVLLPVLVCIWIAIRIVSGFVAGAADRAAYVGFDFIVNGVLLGAIAWLIPVIAAHLSKPSVPGSVVKVLHETLNDQLQSSVSDYRQKLVELHDERLALCDRITELQAKVVKANARAAVLDNQELNRLLMENSKTS